MSAAHAKTSPSTRYRRPKPGDVEQLKRLIWVSLTTLETELRTESDAPKTDHAAQICRISHAISQAAQVYLRCLETSELEKRLQVLEKVGTQPLTWAA